MLTVVEYDQHRELLLPLNLTIPHALPSPSPTSPFVPHFKEKTPVQSTEPAKLTNPPIQKQ